MFASEADSQLENKMPEQPRIGSRTKRRLSFGLTPVSGLAATGHDIMMSCDSVTRPRKGPRLNSSPFSFAGQNCIPQNVSGMGTPGFCGFVASHHNTNQRRRTNKPNRRVPKPTPWASRPFSTAESTPTNNLLTQSNFKSPALNTDADHLVIAHLFGCPATHTKPPELSLGGCNNSGDMDLQGTPNDSFSPGPLSILSCHTEDSMNKSFEFGGFDMDSAAGVSKGSAADGSQVTQPLRQPFGVRTNLQCSTVPVPGDSLDRPSKTPLAPPSYAPHFDSSAAFGSPDCFPENGPQDSRSNKPPSAKFSQGNQNLSANMFIGDENKCITNVPGASAFERKIVEGSKMNFGAAFATLGVTDRNAVRDIFGHSQNTFGGKYGSSFGMTSAALNGFETARNACTLLNQHKDDVNGQSSEADSAGRDAAKSLLSLGPLRGGRLETAGRDSPVSDCSPESCAMEAAVDPFCNLMMGLSMVSPEDQIKPLWKVLRATVTGPYCSDLNKSDVKAIKNASIFGSPLQISSGGLSSFGIASGSQKSDDGQDCETPGCGTVALRKVRNAARHVNLHRPRVIVSESNVSPVSSDVQLMNMESPSTHQNSIVSLRSSECHGTPTKPSFGKIKPRDSDDRLDPSNMRTPEVLPPSPPAAGRRLFDSSARGFGVLLDSVDQPWANCTACAHDNVPLKLQAIFDKMSEPHL